MSDDAPPMEGLTLDGVTIALGSSSGGARRLIDALTLAVAPGTVATLMGPSGSGKSTLLAFICGTLDPAFRATGVARIGSDDLGVLPPERRRVGFLFQDDLLFPHLSVGGNLAFGLRPGVRGHARRERIARALAEIDLAGFEGRDPATLSGGQRARVALARTLLSEPRALLLDEPFSKLDADLKQRFRRFVFDHARARDLPVLLVTHDPADAEAAQGPVHVLPGFVDR